ncbi:hypothetical protein ACQPZJ_38175 [Actinoplanes sp. CA-054009]
MAEDYGKERAARFGRLPERARPDEVVESVDTKVRRGRPEAAMSEEQDRALLSGG